MFGHLLVVSDIKKKKLSDNQTTSLKDLITYLLLNLTHLEKGKKLRDYLTSLK